MQTIREKPKGSFRSVGAFVDALQASGRYTFTREDATAATGASLQATRNALGRLVKKGRIVSPRRGFYVTVPLEYRTAGAPPASWFIDALMAFGGLPYYVGLLSAAMVHGAAHQAPQEFQVITPRPLRPVKAGRGRIRFFTKRHPERTPTIRIATPSGGMRVSTREATALDLVRYVSEAGQLGNVATVLSELAERLDGARLVEAAKADVELSHVQRLGYLLERIGAKKAATPLASWLSQQRPRPVPLRSGVPTSGAPCDRRWLVLVNESVEAEA